MKGRITMIQSIRDALTKQDFSIRSSFTKDIAMKVIHAILSNDYSEFYNRKTAFLGDIIITGDGRKDSVIYLNYEEKFRRIRVHFRFDTNILELPEEYAILTKESVFFAKKENDEDFIFDCFRGYLATLLQRAIIYAICDGLFSEEEFLAKDSSREIDFLEVKDNAREYLNQMQVFAKIASDAIAEEDNEKACDAFYELNEVQQDMSYLLSGRSLNDDWEDDF